MKSLTCDKKDNWIKNSAIEPHLDAKMVPGKSKCLRENDRNL